ncbi:thioredoxin-disulfide reductase [candidate division TM6 bacterium RIFCSPHIGHO2_12_FULL_36_22]|nr:MAG: thioredoxin-disulfide reductase [candidate division TM6 bacterium RIFCSPHIGHO2_12_FULL_36_22]
MSKIHKLIIIGSGPAGLTAGIYASRAQLEPLIVRGKEPGGQLMGTSAVENWPGNISIMGPKLMIEMEKHAKHFGSSTLDEIVTKVDFSKKPFTLWTNKETELKAKCVIIATGATPLRLGIPGESEFWGKGISTCAICDSAFYNDKKIVIVGGGDSAMEMAQFMTKFTNQITIIQIQDQLSASKAMQIPILANKDIKIIYNTAITEIKGVNEKISSIITTNKKTNATQQIELDGLFIAIGLKPQTKFLEGHLELDKYGYLSLKDHTKTSVEGVFGAGDVSDYRYRQAITAAGAGCMAALDAEKYLASLE